MATPSTVKNMRGNGPFDLVSRDTDTNPDYRRIGLLNGGLIGLALAAGAWMVDAFIASQLPIPLQFQSLLLAALLLVALNGFVGWLTSRYEKTRAVLFYWLVSAVLSSLVIGYQPYVGRSLVVWLSDRRFWGLQIYPVMEGVTPIFVAIAGFFVILVLLIFSLLQNYRLEAVHRERGKNGRLSFISLLLLLIPFPFVTGAGLATRNIVGDASMRSAQIVHKAIQVGWNYDGDLVELGKQEGVFVSAIQGVRRQMSPDYTLKIGENNPLSLIIYVVAEFDNGAWINCRVLNEQLSFCYDASPPYTIGFASLITGEDVPEDCRGCLPIGSGAWANWFAERRAGFGTGPNIQRMGQWGGYVLMRAEPETGDNAIECWFNGISPVRLESCIEVSD